MQSICQQLSPSLDLIRVGHFAHVLDRRDQSVTTYYRGDSFGIRRFVSRRGAIAWIESVALATNDLVDVIVL